ncbi:TetR/AcrR family transcriptional regulator [Sphingomonas sp. 28-63-12]|uniref:TetR/AcrR family transcriptional regulator n=1 Tax=Sphingomonas sp. 28-63-12 TaxID=1970434 RepID=UPI000BD50310|nr:MAG: hypothetical protein B7Y47_11190 [Sphingomonas sp. 28-63-12]
MARKQSDHDQWRIDIAEAACKVILENGLEGTRLKEIAAAMGYSVGVLQYYFTSKDELLLFAKNRLFDAKFDRMRAAAARRRGIDRLHAMAMELMPFSDEDRAMFLLLSVFRGQAVGNPVLTARQTERDATGSALFAEEIVALQSSGHVRADIDPGQQAVALVGLLEGMALQATALAAMGRTATSKLVRHYLSVILAAPKAGTPD